MIERKTFEHSETQDGFTTVVIEGGHLIADEETLLSLSIRRASSAVEEGTLSAETLYAFFSAVNNLDAIPDIAKDSFERISSVAIESDIHTDRKTYIRKRTRDFIKEHGFSGIAFAALISIPGAFGIYIESGGNSVGSNFYSVIQKENAISTRLMDIDAPAIIETLNDKKSIDTDTSKKQKVSVNLLSIPYAQAVLNIKFEKPVKNFLQKPDKILGKVLSIPTSKSGYPTGEKAYISFINKAAFNYRVSSSIMEKIIKCESQFEPEIPNSQSSGAYGIAQFMPNTFNNNKINPYISYGISNPYAQIAEMAKLISENQIWRWSCAP